MFSLQGFCVLSPGSWCSLSRVLVFCLDAVSGGSTVLSPIILVGLSNLVVFILLTSHVLLDIPTLGVLWVFLCTYTPQLSSLFSKP